MANSIAVDFPGDVALAVIIVHSGVNGTALIKRTDQRLVTNRLVRSRHAACFRRTDAMFGSVLRCGSTVVHHVAAVILFPTMVSKAGIV